jgi:hypothetical protein
MNRGARPANDAIPAHAQQILAITSLVALAVASVALVPTPIGSLPLKQVERIARVGAHRPPGWALPGLSGIALCALAAFFAMAVRERFRRRSEVEWFATEPRPKAGVLVFLGILALLAGALAALLSIVPWFLPSQGTNRLQTIRTEPTSSASPRSSAQAHGWPAMKATAVPGLALPLGLVLGWYLGSSRKRRVEDKGNQDVPTVLGKAKSRLERGDSVRDAILGCYAEMGRIFAHWLPMDTRTLTAREFLIQLELRGQLAQEILTLTRIFEKARYSLERCVEADRLQALEALETITSRDPGANHMPGNNL